MLDVLLPHYVQVDQYNEVDSEIRTCRKTVPFCINDYPMPPAPIYNKAIAAPAAPRIPPMLTALFMAPDPATAEVAAAPAELAAEAAEVAAPPADEVVVPALAVSADEADDKVDATDSEDSDLEETNSEISELTDEMADEMDEMVDDRAVESMVVAEDSLQVISDGTVTPPVLQILAANAIAACWSVSLQASSKQHPNTQSIKKAASFSFGTSLPMLFKNPPLEQIHLISRPPQPAIPSSSADRKSVV